MGRLIDVAQEATKIPAEPALRLLVCSADGAALGWIRVEELLALLDRLRAAE